MRCGVSFSNDSCVFGFVPEGFPEISEIGLEEADIPAHDTKMRNLPPFDPEVNRLGTDSQKFRCLADVPRVVIRKLMDIFRWVANGRRRKWHPAFHRHDLVPLEQRRLSEPFDFCI